MRRLRCPGTQVASPGRQEGDEDEGARRNASHTQTCKDTSDDQGRATGGDRYGQELADRHAKALGDTENTNRRRDCPIQRRRRRRGRSIAMENT